MNLRFLSLLAVSAALVSGSLTAVAAPHKHSRAISQAQAVKIAKKRVGGGRGDGGGAPRPGGGAAGGGGCGRRWRARCY